MGFSSSASTCATRGDCSDHGDCVNQVCRCDLGWYGAKCGQKPTGKGICTDTRCGGAAKVCCEGSSALQKKDMCIGAVTCDSCCGWVDVGDNGTYPLPHDETLVNI